METANQMPKKIETPDDAHAVFQRVWKRVMPESAESPIMVEEVRTVKEERRCNCAPKEEVMVKETAVRTETSNEGFIMEEDVKIYTGLETGTDEVVDKTARRQVGLAPVLQRRDFPGDEERADCCNDFPSESDVECLGLSCRNFDDLLQEMIRKELFDWLYYRSLSRKVNGASARSFAAMAANEWQHAKRLSAAYFLISGIRYWPEKQSAVSIPSYLSALRERFLAEQQDAAYYTAAATECPDHCLCQLFLEIADGNNQHAQQLRALVEQL